MSDFKLPDLGGLMQAAERMQREMERVQADLGGKQVEASAGGGMVTAVVNGRLELVALRIDPAVIDPAERGMLEDLVVAAVNQALVRARELAGSEMSRVAAGLGLPGLPR